MAWIRLVHDSEAVGRVAVAFRAAIARAGRVFGIVRLMSPSPHTLDASMELYRAIMFGPSPLTRRQREMLAVVTSKANDCHY
jgi:alkylhydroperoxidase family enzyme